MPEPTREELAEALKPFAAYAKYMERAWTARDNSVYYGVKREGAPMVTYGDWRRAVNVMKGVV